MLEIWETETWQRTNRVPGRYSGSYGLAFSPDSKLLAFGGEANRAMIWTADSTVRLWEIEPQDH